MNKAEFLHPPKHTRSERGQSMVELAFSLVVLLILLAGVVDGGRALFTYMALRDAAQEGALYGSTDPWGTEAIIARACKSSNFLAGLACGDAAVASNQVKIQLTVGAGSCAGSSITVRVAYEKFPITMPFLGTFLGQQTVGISAKVTDTVLSPRCTTH